MESDALLDDVLKSDAGTDCVIDPDGAEPHVTIRVLWSTPFEGVNTATGEYGNSAPQAQARRVDVAGVIVPEQTVVQIEGAKYIAQKLERVEGAGDYWRNLVLRSVPAS